MVGALSPSKVRPTKVTASSELKLNPLSFIGPEAASCLQQHVKEDLSKLYFGRSAFMDVAGVKCHVARGGYTGEDGFEVREHMIHTLSLPGSDRLPSS